MKAEDFKKAKTMVSAMTMTHVDIYLLQTRPRLLRRHNAMKVEHLATFISKTNIIIPLLVDKNNMILVGNARYAAAKLLGLETIPVIYVDHLSPEMIRALVIADNQFCINAGWEEKLLNEELAELEPILRDQFDLTLGDLGFETAEVDIRLGEAALLADADETPTTAASKPAITKPGDAWMMGPHKLVCGDSRLEATYLSLMQDQHAGMIFTDAPYNLKVEDIVGKGAIQHKEFAMASGEMSPEQFIAFLAFVFVHLRKFSKDGSVHFQFMDFRHSHEILTAGMQAGYSYLNLCVWVKDNGGMGSLYRSRHELLHVFKSGTAPHTNNVKLGKHGRYRTNVWEYAGVNSFKKGRMEELAMHPTVKPVALIADAIKDCSARGDIILDPFAGSGSTLIAAEMTDRKARLIEIDPHYCDVIVRRWQQLTGRKAMLQDTNETFSELFVAAEVASHE